jgi:cytochrome c-type biogenesis protein CcmH/NrfG
MQGKEDMEASEIELYRGSRDVLREEADQRMTNARVSKERIALRIRRSRQQGEVNAMPSVAEIVVRIAGVIMLIALCVQAIHR